MSRLQEERETHPLAEAVPGFARRLLVMGGGEVLCGELGASREVVRSASRETPPSGLDALLFVDEPDGPEDFWAAMDGLVPVLGRDGCILVTVRHAGYWAVRAGRLPAPVWDKARIAQAIEAAGYVWYAALPVVDTRFAVQGYDPLGPVRMGGAFLPVESAQAFAALASYGELVVGVPVAYNPISHARRLFDAGRPAWSHEVLAHIPDPYLTDPAVAASIAAERQLCLLAADSFAEAGAGGEGLMLWGSTLERFSDSQRLFHFAVSEMPREPPPYQCQAEFWRRLGDERMAAGIRRSLETALGDGGVASVWAGPLAAGRGEPSTPSAPAIEVCSRPPRVLFVLPSRPHYGLDVLYDGLSMVLGDDCVTDYPWKPSLHGVVPEKFRHYPCLFNRPGTQQPLERVLALLREGAFDVMLFGDAEMFLARAVARRLVSAADIPVFLVDQEDDPKDRLSEFGEYLGCPDRVKGGFKREMLACVDYDPRVCPLPFAYPDGRVPEHVTWSRETGLFWAGGRMSGMRRLYLEHLERVRGERLDAAFEQEQYAATLQGCRIGLSLPGNGFDTVRYWELPAHGCMLLSERLPIWIPEDFVDGESAVFFDDLAELEAKLAYFEAHDEEAIAIAQAGRERLIRYHTGSARARQLLGRIEESGGLGIS